MLHGWLVVDKPVGPGSTQIVAAVKRALREGGYTKVKVGHGGTLDPLASGVLPVALGEATKLSGRMLAADKAYEFTIAFGVETDTLDAEGDSVATSAARPVLAQVEAVLPRFIGAIEQVPPAFSALKVQGKRAYARARAGEQVAMPARRVTVHELEFLPGTGMSGHAMPPAWLRMSGGHAHLPMTARRRRVVEELALSPEQPLHLPAAGPPSGGEELEEITLAATVSKGTYIRSLARDLARGLDTVGHVTMLRRTKAGPFTLDGAISLDKLTELAKARQLEQALLPLAAGLDDIPALPVTPDQARALRQGRKAIGTAAKPGLHLATDNEVPVALVELSEGELRVVRGFNL